MVEDDPKPARLYQQAFAGCTFDWARSATEALEFFGPRMPELILLDHILAGGETGLAFPPQ